MSPRTARSPTRLNANAHGSDSFTFTATDGDGVSNEATITITITSVNDAPSFTAGPDQGVLEDSGLQAVPGWATDLSSGPANESGQNLTFVVDSVTPNLFTGSPAVSPSGTLSFTPAPNANGTASITLHVEDDGGTSSGGVDASATQTFTITITPVNDAPSFTKGSDALVDENNGPVSDPGWATAISPGPANESGQTVDFVVTADTNPGLFSVLPAVSAGGTLTFTPAASTAGSASITLHVRDSGGTANGGDDTGPNVSFTISVTGINDAPSFTKGGNQTDLEDAGPQSVSGWATAISAGPPDESGQAAGLRRGYELEPRTFLRPCHRSARPGPCPTRQPRTRTARRRSSSIFMTTAGRRAAGTIRALSSRSRSRSRR